MGDVGEHNKATVLIVDDGQGPAADVAELVRRADRRVLCADSADDALSILDHNLVDVVVMSTGFGSDDGFTTCRQIRTKRGVGDVPVLLVSAERRDDTIIAGLDAGADDVWIAPLDGRIVAARVQAILRLDRHRRLLEQGQRLTGAKEQIAAMRDHDGDTGLPNRAMFAAGLRRELARAERSDYPLAVLVIEISDYDDLQAIYGPAEIAALHRTIADRLSDAVRGRALIGRLDARCYSVCQPLPRAEELTHAVHNYRRALAEPFALDRDTVELATSIGASLFPNDAPDDERLIGLAHSAMSHARHMGRNKYHVLGPAARNEARRRLSLESLIRRALLREDLFLHYQPRVRLADGAVTAVEAFLRVRDEAGGLVGPQVFIPIAEDSGLMERLGVWALERACADAVSLIDAGFDLRVAVNIAASLFSKDTFYSDLKSVLGAHNLDGTGLELEVTESALRPRLFGSLLALQRHLAQLEEEGVTLTLDNFGTGYSCLDTLRHLPLDILKIDQRFVGAVADDPNMAAIVASLITVGQSLGLRVVGQGVEREDQAECLRDAGCHAAQGYLFARPVPLTDLHDCLRALDERRRAAAVPEAAAALP